MIVVQEPATSTNANISLLRPRNTHRPSRFCSNLQLLKRRQQAHCVRNRARQLIGGQGPANRRTQQHSGQATTRTHQHRLCYLFPLTGSQARTAGPSCSESCPSVDWRTRPCKSSSSVNTTIRIHCANSQVHKQRKPAHSARNRACQLIGVQVPAKQPQNLLSDHPPSRLCSTSQDRKRRQLAHGTRNRAGQSIAV